VPARDPRQARSRATRARILDAAEAIVAGRGFEEAGVAMVVRRAGCSVGAFYSRFRDKQGLLAALYERFSAELSARIDASLDPARWSREPLARCLHGLVRALIELHRQRRGLARAFAVEGQRDPAFQAHRDRLVQSASLRLAAFARERSREIGHHHPDRAISFGLAVIWSSVESAVLFDRLRSSALAPTDDDLAAELVRQLVGYLGLAEA
jgi:AcrR family transcriptional regulator